MIPGSPGLADFYIDFCSVVHGRFAEHMDIVCVSHLGHTRFHDNRGTVHRDDRVPSLEDQLANMLLVFDEIDDVYRQLDQPPQILLCAHSVGCYFAQRLVEQRSERIDRVFGLFPAVESMAETPRGRELGLLFRPGVRQAVAAAADVLRWLLPLRALYAMAASTDSLEPRSARLVVDKMLYGSCIRCILGMADDELRMIGSLDEDLYRTHGHKFVLYYGADDGWVPDECHRRMREANTQGRIILCDRGISHAFVTLHSAEMAAVVVEMLAEQLASAGGPPAQACTPRSQ
ncbi:hypothetical protein H4R19_007280 [Coemansia spiralis]|nr:hypothetical protein H4R19_007280 [Coemansia spiralis]